MYCGIHLITMKANYVPIAVSFSISLKANVQLRATVIETF